MPNESRQNSPDELGRSFAALVGDPAWDGGDASGPEPPPPAGTGVPPSPRRIVEALLFIGGAPLSPQRAGEVVRGLTPDQFARAVDELNQLYRKQGRPYHVQSEAAGYVLTLRPGHHGGMEKLFGGVREARLSNAAIDVLALVA